MTAHELARKLLTMDDVNVFIREPSMCDYELIIVGLVESKPVYASPYGSYYEYALDITKEEKAVYLY